MIVKCMIMGFGESYTQECQVGLSEQVIYHSDSLEESCKGIAGSTNQDRLVCNNP